jgi:GNAT superfamily N-acetyltransferase
MFNQQLAFRPAGPEELETGLRLLKEAALWLHAKNIDYWQEWLAPPDNFVRWIKRGFDNHEFFIVENESDVIGCFRLQWEDAGFWGERNDAAGYLHSFTTTRHAHGTGKLILNWIEDYCRENHKDFLRLDCGASNQALRNYYENNGFQPVGEITVYQPLVLYEKILRE